MKLLILFFIAWLGGWVEIESLASQPTRTPEQESALLGKYLKPISNDAWSLAAGPKVTEKYSIIKGDTLFDISKRLFGDPKYWPKIWALNNSGITNPHKIRPGYSIVFSSGTGNTLPTVGLAANTAKAPNSLQRLTDTPAPSPEENLVRSTEWKNLPKQSWENFQVKLSPEIDPLGFDKNNKIAVRAPVGFESQALPATQELKFIGQIVGSRSESQYLTLGDLIYIHADQTLEVGKIYSITQEPSILKSKKSDRIGYSYLMLGKVKILGMRDKLYLGRITTTRGFVSRGCSIIPAPPKVPELTPIPGPKPLEGDLLIDKNFSTFTTAQHKEVFINRGSDDGIQPGMIFRVYEHFDPGSDKRVSKKNFIIDADIMVTQVSPQFSTAIVVNNHSPIYDQSVVVLLTDLSDFGKNDGFSEINGNNEDDLDPLDDKKSLNSNELKELKQLEEWKGNPSPLPSGEPLPVTSGEPLPVTSGEPLPVTSGEPLPVTSGEPLPNPSEELLPPPAPLDLEAGPPPTEPSPTPNSATEPLTPPSEEVPPTTPQAAPESVPPPPTADSKPVESSPTSLDEPLPPPPEN